jgi:hypothetical protein
MIEDRLHEINKSKINIKAEIIMQYHPSHFEAIRHYSAQTGSTGIKQRDPLTTTTIKTTKR